MKLFPVPIAKYYLSRFPIILYKVPKKVREIVPINPKRLLRNLVKPESHLFDFIRVLYIYSSLLFFLSACAMEALHSVTFVQSDRSWVRRKSTVNLAYRLTTSKFTLPCANQRNLEFSTHCWITWLLQVVCNTIQVFREWDRVWNLGFLLPGWKNKLRMF